MCYSAMVNQKYRDFIRQFDADIGIDEFVALYIARASHPAVKIPKAMDANFSDPRTEPERRIIELITAQNRSQAEKWQQELFKQRTRLAEAERSLQAKVTKKAESDRRIATEKVEWLLGKLADLNRIEAKAIDSRIFPMHYAPVMVWENGRRVVKPMRYHCRPAGKPAFYDSKYPGCYNARRDNLEGFWKGQFGVSHGLILVSAFFENVSRHRLEKRELGPDEKDENVILEFRPQGGDEMLVACLWSRWVGSDGEALLSFAAITDEPPAEVAAAGHDRCIIPIRRQSIDDWLKPDGDLQRAYAILDDRERPYYDHRMAA
jgi:putative SOS response-associated peptidase YedK